MDADDSQKEVSQEALTKEKDGGATVCNKYASEGLPVGWVEQGS